MWTAIDLDSWEILSAEATGGRSILEAIAFLRPVKALCAGKAPRVFIDGGDWYPPALEHVGFRRYNVVAFGPRSAIEQFVSTVDHRYRAFYEHFPYRSTLTSLRRWGRAVGGFHMFRPGLT